MKNVSLKTFMSVRSGVASEFPGGWIAHLEGQNEEENENSLRKICKNLLKFWWKMRKVEILPTGDCEAGYGPVCMHKRVRLSLKLDWVSVKFSHGQTDFTLQKVSSKFGRSECNIQK